jgi:hypothetical protein
MKLTKKKQGWVAKYLISQIREEEKSKELDELIAFQLFLNQKGLITNYDWDYEKIAKKYINAKTTGKS